MNRFVITSALIIFSIICISYPIGAEEEYDGKVEWSVEVPEIETTLYDYLTKERTYEIPYFMDVHKTSQPHSEVVGVLQEGEFTVMEAFTSWSDEAIPIDMGGNPVCAYISAYKIKSADLKGWIFKVYTPVDILIRFNDDYYPLREGPSPEYPLLTREEETGLVARYDYALGSTVENGYICRPICIFDGWMSVGRDAMTIYGEAGGWLPVDTPGLEFFIPAFSGLALDGEFIPGGFHFYIPCGFASPIIYESSSIYPGSFTDEFLSLTVLCSTGNEYVFERAEYCDPRIFGGHDFRTDYRVYQTDTPVDWAEVERVYVKLNEPRLLLENDEFAFDFPNERLPRE